MHRFSQEEVARLLRIERRKRWLRERGIRYSDIGSKGCVSMVITERWRYPKLRRLIARKAGVSFRRFWAGAN